MNFQNILGTLVKDNDTYQITDNTFLENLVLSKTMLHPHKHTRGHSHPGQEEIYFFISGTGIMELGDKKFPVKDQDIVLIPDGIFHKVYNESDQNLEFICVFDGKRNH